MSAPAPGLRPLALALAAAVGLATSGARAELLALSGDRTVIATSVEGRAYVAMEDLAAVLDLDHEYSYETGSYSLVTPEGRPSVTVVFQPGSQRLVVNREERLIPFPPLEHGSAVLVPVDPFVALLSGTPAAPGAAAEARRLVDFACGQQSGFTRLEFLFSAPAELVTTASADQATLVLRFAGAESALPTSRPPPVPTLQVSKVEFRPPPTRGRPLEVRVALHGRARPEVFTLDDGRRVVVDVVGEGASATPSSGHERDLYAACKVVLDPGHGGSDPGAPLRPGFAEKAAVLAMARRAQAALRTSSFEVELARQGDVELPMLARINVISAASPDAVISLHAVQPSDVSSLPRVTLVVLRAKAAAEDDAQADDRAIYSPSSEEVRSARQLAERLAAALREAGLPCSLLELPHVLPAARVMAPTVLVECQNFPTAAGAAGAPELALTGALQRGLSVYFAGLLRERNSPEPAPAAPVEPVAPTTAEARPVVAPTFAPLPGSLLSPDEEAGR